MSLHNRPDHDPREGVVNQEGRQVTAATFA